MNNEKNKDIVKEYDIFKDSLLRYVGYSNEIGEAFRPIVPRFIVNYSYVIEFGYFIGDIFHKGHKAYHINKHDDNVYLKVSKAGAYTIVWQFFASALIPALAINRIVWMMGKLTNRYSKNINVKKYIPTMIGLIVIPVMPLVLDPFVDKIMKKSLERYV